jgi:hypothetical protein
VGPLISRASSSSDGTYEIERQQNSKISMVDLDLADAKQQPDLHERETRRDQEGAPGMPRIRSRQGESCATLGLLYK